MLNDFLPNELEHSNSTIDVPRFRLTEFAKLLKEPVSLLQSQSYSKLNIGKVLTSVARVRNEASFETLKVCPLCCEDGYHSILHQIPWIERCIFHQLPLKEITFAHHRKGGLAPDDVLLADPLYKIWFSPEGPWASAKTSNWAFKNHGRFYRAIVKQVQYEAQEVDDELTKEAARYEGTFPIVEALHDRTRLYLTLRLTGEAGEQFRRQVQVGEHGGISHAHLAMARREQVIQMMRLGFSEIEILCRNRTVACGIADEAPKWRQVLYHWLQRTEGHHASCIASFHKIYWRWNDGCSEIWGRHTRTHCLALAQWGAITCVHTILAEIFRNSFLKFSFDLNPHHAYLVPSEWTSIVKLVNGYSDIPVAPLISELGASRSDKQIFIANPQGAMAELCDFIILSRLWQEIAVVAALSKEVARLEGRDRLHFFRWTLEAFIQQRLRRLTPAYVIRPDACGISILTLVNYPYALPNKECDAKHFEQMEASVRHINRVFRDQALERRKRVDAALQRMEQWISRA